MAETIFGLTDTGRQRQNNEDAFIAETVLNGRYLAAGVIDGVGGYEGGEVAADITKNTLLNYLTVPSGSAISMLEEALRSANDKILQHKKMAGANGQMACVATVALVEKEANKIYYAHVGDTRLYLFRDGSLVKLTKDQSFVGFLEDNGRLSETEAMQHPKRNEINKALGFEVIPAHSDYIETGDSPFLPGDMLLLCSDGLTDMIDKASIISILNDSTPLSQKASALIASANAAGGKDNITVVLVKNEHKAAKQKSIKPTAAKQPLTVKTTEKEASVTKNTAVPGKSNRGLLFFFVGLSLVAIAAFLWQWFSHSKADAVTQNQPLANNLTPSEQQLRDSLQTANGVLFLANTVYGDTFSISHPLLINGDSVHIKGGGQTIISGMDNDSSESALVIAPSVRYLLLDSLSLQNLSIKIPAQNLSAVHLYKVRFLNAGIQPFYHFDDSLLTTSFDSSLQKRQR